MYEFDKILAPLPNVLSFNGSKIETPEEWNKNRETIMTSVIELEYGGMPPKPEVFEMECIYISGAGGMDSYRIYTGSAEKQMSFVLQVYRPKTDGKCPVILTGDGCFKYCGDAVIEEANRRGFAVAKFNRTEFAPDIYNSDRISGLYKIYPELHFSAISAWAWGYHRAVDALLTLDFIDPEQIAITGHSRGGKTVLLAGATDERIKYTNPNDSGAHGCGCYRYEQYEEEGAVSSEHRSERLEDLVRAVPYWMGPEMKNYIGRESELPHDMHFMKAFVAPRYFLETEALGDIWGNPKGSYQTYLAAREVYRLLGCEDNIAVRYREGKHKHSYEDFVAFMDFMDFIRRGEALPECYRENPYPDMEPMGIE